MGVELTEKRDLDGINLSIRMAPEGKERMMSPRNGRPGARPEHTARSQGRRASQTEMLAL